MATRGRPPRFSTPEEMQEAFYDYQDEFKEGGSLVDEIPDVESFCYYIGSYRELLMEYERKPLFSRTVKEIKDWLQYKKKQLAMAGKMPPAIFIFDAKNNAGYVDKTEVDENQQVTHKYEDMDDEQLAAAIQARKDRAARA
jgi:hypothetical protein